MTVKPMQIASEHSNQMLQEYGILALAHPAWMPTFNEPFLSNHLVIILNLKGSARVEYDTEPIDFRENDVFVLMPKHTVNILYVSEDIDVRIIVITQDRFELMKRHYADGYQENIHYHWRACFHLDEQQASTIRSLHEVFYSVCWSESNRKKYLFHHMLETIFMLLQEYRISNGVASREPSPRELILANFMDAIMKHYTESREVRYYANIFCLSPKHFSAIVKQQSGKNASDWISDYVIVQAKSLLCYQHQLSIQQIAQRLGFPDQASFARYFKTNTGMSAREFRDSRELT